MGRDRLLPSKGDLQTFNGSEWVPLSFTNAFLLAVAIRVLDSVFSIIDDGDNSKTLTFQVGTQATGLTTTIDVGAQTGSRTFSLPVATGNDTIAAIGVAQTFSATQTFSGLITSTNTTASTSKDTGAFVTEGGIGVEGQGYFGGGVQVSSGQALKVDGGGGELTFQTTGRTDCVVSFKGSGGTTFFSMYAPNANYMALFTASRYVFGSVSELNTGYAGQFNGGIYTTSKSLIGTIGSTFPGNIIAGVQDGTAVVAGQVGEVIESVISTAQNAAATGTYLALTSISLEGDWLISGWVETIPNGATLTVDAATELVIGTTSASNAGSTAGDDRVTENHALGTGVRHQIIIPHKRVNVAAATTYYLNVLATYTLGTPQWVGTIRATRIR